MRSAVTGRDAGEYDLTISPFSQPHLSTRSKCPCGNEIEARVPTLAKAKSDTRSLACHFAHRSIRDAAGAPRKCETAERDFPGKVESRKRTFRCHAHCGEPRCLVTAIESAQGLFQPRRRSVGKDRSGRARPPLRTHPVASSGFAAMAERFGPAHLLFDAISIRNWLRGAYSAGFLTEQTSFASIGLVAVIWRPSPGPVGPASRLGAALC